MTPEQAKAIGFSGALAPGDGRELLLVACAPKDAKFIENRLNTAQPVTGFRAHEVDD